MYHLVTRGAAIAAVGALAVAFGALLLAGREDERPGADPSPQAPAPLVEREDAEGPATVQEDLGGAGEPTAPVAALPAQPSASPSGRGLRGVPAPGPRSVVEGAVTANPVRADKPDRGGFTANPRQADKTDDGDFFTDGLDG